MLAVRSYLTQFLFLPDIDAPISQGGQRDEVFVDQSKIDTLVSFGFTEELARKALKATVSSFYHLPIYVSRNYC